MKCKIAVKYYRNILRVKILRIDKTIEIAHNDKKHSPVSRS